MQNKRKKGLIPNRLPKNDEPPQKPLLVSHQKASALNDSAFANLPDHDGTYTVRGNTMLPLIDKGDVLFFKLIDSPDQLIWGQVYIVSFGRGGSEHTMIKYVDKSVDPNYIKLHGGNPDYVPTEILWDSITAIAIVKASVRLNEFN